MQFEILITFILISSYAALKLRIPQGELQGRYVETVVHNQTMSGDTYLGIPFARPPVGSLRWTDPQPLRAWNGTLDATQFKPGCMQNLTSIYAMGNCPTNVSEDCLFLNVFTPPNAARTDRDQQSLFPVMVWIHGGGMATGSGGCLIYEGLFLSNTTNQIVVTINYRLNSFGFLTTPSISGNFGMKDQRMALKWIRNNIRYFGGNPHSLTIFGESAGGMSVHYHLVSPSSGGLFHKAIMQSNPVTEFNTRLAGLAIGENFTSSLGCSSTNLTCLQALDVNTIVASTEAMNLGTFVPTIDGGCELPDNPLKLILEGRYNRVPTILGTTKYEYALFVPFNYPNGVPASVYEGYVNQTFGQRAREVLGLYPVVPNSDNTLTISLLLTHQQFSCPGRQLILAINKYNPPEAGGYLYYLDHPASIGSLFGPLCTEVACHAEDLLYVFDSIEVASQGGMRLTPEEQRLSLSMQKYWGHFSKTGVPNPPGEISWPRYTLPRNQSINFDISNHIVSGNLQQYCAFWDLLIA